MLTIEQRVTSLEARVSALEGPPPPPPPPPPPILTTFPYARRNTNSNPAKDSDPLIAWGAGDVIAYPYSPAMIHEGKVRLYYQGWGVPIIGTSQSGLGGTFAGAARPVGSIPYGSILKARNKFWAMDHVWISGNCFTRCWESTDGVTFTNNGTSFASGEDQALWYNAATNEFYCYVRTIGGGRGPRTISFTKSSDFRNWSPLQLILSMDAQDLAEHKEFYSMPVAKVGNEYWGFLNVLRKGNSGQDVEQLPPYQGDEQTIDVQLTRSVDGRVFKRCGNKQVFIKRPAGCNQMIATVPIVTSTEIQMFTLECGRRHTTYDESNPNGKFFSIGRYVMSLTDLVKWRPV